MFDEKGNVKWDLVPARRWKAYPDPHTKWDTIKLPANLSLEESIAWLKSTHNLKLLTWSVTVKDGEGKYKGQQIYAEPPVDRSVDEALLLNTVSLEDTQQKAISSIMRCAAMKNKQAYTARWKLLREMNGAEYRRKMETKMRALLEESLGSLKGIREIPLEVQLEVADEAGVEAVTPPLILPM